MDETTPDARRSTMSVVREMLPGAVRARISNRRPTAALIKCDVALKHSHSTEKEVQHVSQNALVWWNVTHCLGR
jgi:hypothetical protein